MTYFRFNFVYMHACTPGLCMWVCAHKCGCPRRPKGGVSSPGTGVFEPSHLGVWVTNLGSLKEALAYRKEFLCVDFVLSSRDGIPLCEIFNVTFDVT